MPRPHSHPGPSRRRQRSGQVALEAALMMPFTLFMILGILQLSLIQQARLMAHFAAFRAARSGALNQAKCQPMIDAAVESILPSYGRTDDGQALAATWTTDDPKKGNPSKNLTNVTGIPTLLNIIHINYQVDYLNGAAPQEPYSPGGVGAAATADFDDPGNGQRLSLQVLYAYEMRIPFANWMISEMWTGGNYFNNSINVLSPTLTKAAQVKPVNQLRIAHNVYDPGHSDSRYFVPLPASSSMRMMSNPQQSTNFGNAMSCP